MNLEQKIIWTALPNGYKDKHTLHLSVFVSPRLVSDPSDPTLVNFPDFAAWPKTVANLQFIVETDAPWKDKFSPDLSQLDGSLWKSLFADTTYVRPHEFPAQYADRVIHTYPVRSVMAYLKDIYQQAGASSPGDLPGLPGSASANNALIDLVSDLGIILNPRDKERDHRYQSLLDYIKVIPPGQLLQSYPFQNQVQQDFYQVQRFYSRPENQEAHLAKPDASLVPAPLKPPELDFHQALAALGDHPAALRKLGLLIDLYLPAEALLQGGGRITVTPLWDDNPPSSFNVDLTPVTHFQVDKKIFLSQPRFGSSLVSGMLDLRDASPNLADEKPAYHLLEVDPDGLAIKAIDFASTMYRLWKEGGREPAGIDIGDRAGLPSMQSGGLALLANGRAFRLHHHFVDDINKNNALLANSGDLYADELLRGYRVDIFDADTSEWRSLCRRDGQLIFHNTGESVPFDDEGYVKSASASSKDDANSDLYFHEAMFKWNGWSLVAPRPGKTITQEKVSPTEVKEHMETQSNPPATPFGLETVAHASPGSLPRLRFGRTYRMRVRAVDLGGYSLPDSSKDDSFASQRVEYYRYEPVAPPVLVLRRPLTEGESSERMVIRSNFDHSTVDYVNQAEIQAITTTKPYGSYLAENDRHVVPPKTSQLMAEMHGSFDPYFTPLQFDLGFRIAKKEAGMLFDKQIWNFNTSLYEQLKDILPEGVDTVEVITTASGENQIVLHKEKQLLLPYLPDPAGSGAAFRFLPEAIPGGTPLLECAKLPDGSYSLLVPFQMDWPQAEPFRISIIEREGKMEGDNCQETLASAFAPPVWDKTARLLTVFLPKAALFRLRYSTYLEKHDLQKMGAWRWLEEANPANLGDLFEYARAGSHWMISPFRELVLVHAVQQPLCEPRIFKLDATRHVGDTFAQLSGTFHLSAASTEKLDLQAEWEEWVDDLNDDAPKRVKGSGRAFETRVLDPAKDDINHPQWDRRKHEFGDTHYRSVNYHLTGTTRFREYFPPEITADEANITRRGPLLNLGVPNSARPKAPKLLYILPTFRWEEALPAGAGDPWQHLVRRRLGNGLRVYMERTWYSSGDDEKLGVVLWPDAGGGFNNHMNYVSLIGQDPIHDANRPHGVLTPQHFTNLVESRYDLSLLETTFPHVAVAAFDVEFHTGRKLWFSDILFDSERMTSYYPFVRLALTRYQPHSIPDTHLSPLVLSDFIQLAPDRTLEVRFIDAQSFTVQVHGYGPTRTTANRVTVELQRRDPGIPGDLGWVSIQTTDPDAPSPMGQNPNYWRWDLKMALPTKRGEQPYRVLVQEYEYYTPDADEGTVQGRHDRRVVYADAVEV